MIRTGSLFTQILSLFQRSDFERHARELKSEYRSKGFSSWDQFVAMFFCQLLAVPLQFWLGRLQPGGPVALESVQLPQSLGMDQPPL
jgi:hypothetical protein